MLCDRTYADPEVELNRGRLRSALIEQRAGNMARNLLAELRANAEIVIE